MNNQLIDMASVSQALRPFSGEKEEDPNQWLRDVRMVCQAVGLNEVQVFTMIKLKLRDQAQSWAAQVLAEDNNMELSVFLPRFVERFGGNVSAHLILNKFLARSITGDREVYIEMLKEGTLLLERGLITVKSLMNMTISKSPIEIKSLLYQIASNTMGDWQEFIRIAEDSSWMAYPEKGHSDSLFSNAIQHGEKRLMKKTYTKKRFCLLCGEGNHSSNYCRILKSKVGEMRNSRRSVNGLSYEEESEVSLNEKDEYCLKKLNAPDQKFYLSNIVSNIAQELDEMTSNPFKTFIFTQKCGHEGLLDTGADCSIINVNNIHDFSLIKSTEKNLTIKTASNNRIKIIGKVENYRIIIKDKTYFLSALVTDEFPRYTILGINFIKKYPSLLDEFKLLLLKQGSRLTGNKEICSIKKLVEENAELFKDEVTQKQLCTRGLHTIETGNAKPTRQYNSRIAYNLQPIIKQELSRLLKLGIIKKSDSAWCSRIIMVKKPDDSYRMVLDFGHVNDVTVKDLYPVPNISEMLDRMGRAKYFSIVDATSGYHQIALTEESKDKTAFRFDNISYVFNRMAFGLCNAPGAFQKVMDDLLVEITETSCCLI